MGTDENIVSSACSEVDRWKHILAFLQEAGLVLDYLHNRIVVEKLGGEVAPSSLFGQLSDADGDLTEDLIVKHLETIARTARAGFVEGDGFPVFAQLENRTFQKEEA